MELIELLIEDQEYHNILQRAVEHEEKNSANPHYLGWEWSDVRAYPAKLVKLVVKGFAKINFKSNKSTCYLLTDRTATKNALKQIKR